MTAMIDVMGVERSGRVLRCRSVRRGGVPLRPYTRHQVYCQCRISIMDVRYGAFQGSK